MDNKFIVISTAYNKGNYVSFNVNSIKQQSYKNYLVIYGYDLSTDSTLERLKYSIEDDDKFIIHHNTNKKGLISNFLNCIKYLKDNNLINPEDIIVEVDADDWLLHPFVFEYLNRAYQDPNIWMSYGQYITYPLGQLGGHFTMALPEDGNIRKNPFAYSHLKTYKAWLFDKLSEEDLINPETGEYWRAASDLAISMPMVEMAGKDRIIRLDQPIYVYNVSDGLESESKGRLVEQKQCDFLIRQLKPYEKLQSKYIINILSGGLGNMMFQLAAAYALARKYNQTLLLNPNHVGTLHKAPMDYKDSVFRNIKMHSRPLDFYQISEESFSYKPLESVNENIALNGYFQSYKYFKDCQKEIRDLYSFEVESKYDIKKKVSMHIRRGNYTQLSEHHHNLSINYYLSAMEQFPEYDFLVFSDDIKWCKEQFLGSRYTFVEETTDIEDLYLMSQCEHNIIANSTFSWWGAFLNKNPHKTVVYPDKWFGPVYNSWDTKDLFPEDWICVNETNN
jgi:glycosyltransferase involved in cell wall biosynthesis